MIRVLILYIAFFESCVNGLKVDLTTSEWFVKDESNEHLNVKVTKIPSGIYTDLMNNQVIEDIFYGFNDNTTKWVSRRNWTYYTNMSISGEELQMENLNLIFEGVDTVSEIYLNNILIGKTDNMFVQYILDIKPVAKKGDNKLEIKFQSPIELAEKLAKEFPDIVPIYCPGQDLFRECYVNMLRKMQSSFSWDWGPAFPSVGIWKKIYRESYNSTMIRYVTTDVEKNNDTWTLYINVYFSNNNNNNNNQNVKGELLLVIGVNSRNISKKIKLNHGVNEFNEIVLSTTFIIPELFVDLWWPNGLGNPTLYDLETRYKSENGQERCTLIKKIGFRTVELVQDKIENGLSFYFKINGYPIFMKGSNLIPISILPENDDDENYLKKLFHATKYANMNMLRVWGGGVYESDTFYSLADQSGILIWQDFMFACALYPASTDYLNNVVEEVRHQIKRLHGHPSIILYSGNNENEAILASSWYNTSQKYPEYKRDYIKLYINTVKKEFDRLTNKRGIFISSSPTNGLKTIKERYIAKDPGSNLFGDVHFYNYFLDGLDWKNYPTPRFASEYGYQSFPSISTLLTATDVKNLYINSTFIKFRQHHPYGNEQMKLAIDYQLNLPEDNTTLNYFRTFVYYTQIIQAMAIKIETEHYRIYKSILQDNGQGLTMGALYWQLNDVWVAPTWSSIDFKGKWKMLHYFARNFFAPVLLTAEVDASGNANIYVVSELLEKLNETVRVQIYNFSSFEAVFEKDIPLNLQNGTSSLVYILNHTIIDSLGCKSKESKTNKCFIYLNFVNASFPGNYIFLQEIKKYAIETPNIQIKSIQESIINDEKKLFKITIQSDKIALFVWLELKNDIDGFFSENGFLQITELKEIFFTTLSKVTVDDLKKSVTVISLMEKQFE